MNPWIAPLVGGALIGLAASLFWVVNGRVAGVSGILHDVVLSRGAGRAEKLAFLAGLVAVGVVGGRFFGVASTSPAPFGALLVAGVLVGFGTRLGGGCTSGHGVCGISRWSPRSLVATATFIATGALTVFVVGHVVPHLVGAP